MSKNHGNILKKIIINYLKQSKHKNIFFADSDNKYNQNQFVSKVFKYQSELEKIWKNQKKNRSVGILLDRSIDYIAVIFATWLCKGYYVPLSILSPKKNINYQINNSNLSLIAHKKKGVVRFKKILNKQKKILINDDQIAYIIFTSGSTGQKKGVIIKKSSFINYIKNLKKVFEKKRKSKSILINGEMTFDISLADFAFAFIFNAGLSITNDSRNLISLIYMLNKYKINSLYVVPSTLEKIVHFLQKNKNYNFLNTIQINCGGELLPYKLIKDAKKIFKKADFYNFYGPTEFTINSTYHKIDLNRVYKSDTIPIGKPLPNIKYIIKKNKKNDSQGELLLNGDQLMYGYTNAKNPFLRLNKQIYYKTGDLVNENKKDGLYFVSREKDYIKHLGYRINLENIQKIISKKCNTECKIVYKKNILFGFIKSKKKINSNIILNKTKSSLENYELPNKFIFLNDFFYSSSGKIDLPKMIDKYIK
jgi:long-subunit acyl-CoA synthetase (AMP-forming)